LLAEYNPLPETPSKKASDSNGTADHPKSAGASPKHRKAAGTAAAPRPGPAVPARKVAQ
jgi:hypothetical protein